MLAELYIENIAVIEQADIDFSRGFLDWSDQAPDSFSGRGAGINYSAMLDNDRKKQARKKRVDGRL